MFTRLQALAAPLRLLISAQAVLFAVLVILPWIAVLTGFYVFHSYAAAFLLYGLGCCFLPVLVFSQFTEHRIARSPIQKFLAINGVVILAGTFLIWPLLEPSFIAMDVVSDQFKQVNLLTHTDFWILAIYMTIVNPVLEEYFWRGYLYEQLKSVMPTILAVLVSSFFFGLWHYVIIQHFFAPAWHIPLTMLVMLGGVIFAWLYERNGIFDAILAHGLAADLPVMLVVYHVMSGTVWLT